MAITDSTTRLINRYFDELHSGALDDVEEILAPDIVVHGVGTVRGREQFVDVQSTVVHEAFPDLTVDVEAMFGDDDTIAVRATMRGTQQGAYLGIEPTNEQVAVETITIFRVTGGKIAEVWSAMDSLSWFQQLGAVPLLDWQEGVESSPGDN